MPTPTWQTIISAVKTAMQNTTGFTSSTVTLNGDPPKTRATLAMNIVDRVPDLQKQDINGQWTFRLPVDLEIYGSNAQNSMSGVRTAVYNVLAVIGNNATWSGNATLTDVEFTEKEISHGEYVEAITVIRLTIQYNVAQYTI